MKPGHDVTVQRDVPWELRDGTVLYCDIYRPAGDGPFPVLLERTPYNKSFQVLVTPVAHEERDGYDSVELAAALPGSNGRVGMFGGSYSGATQWLAAVTDPPHLECVAPAVTAADYHDGWTYRGGALNQGFVQTWATLLAQDVARRQGRTDVEAACVDAYEEFGTRFSGQRLLIGPWHHSPFAELVNGTCFGPEARGGIVARAQARWWERWLREDGAADDSPAMELFCLGEHVWHRPPDWPPPATRTEYFLHSDGDALSLNGNGRLSTVAPTVGGRSCCRDGAVPMGPADQRGVEIGPVLHAATSARDTDWTAKLVDVHPDGRAVNLADGIIRARYRSSLHEPELLEPDRTYEYVIDLGSTCTRFAPGHRVRLEIASSNFPTYDRNLNTGGPIGAEPVAAAVMADQTVFHDPARPSRLVLPIIAA